MDGGAIVNAAQDPPTNVQPVLELWNFDPFMNPRYTKVSKAYRHREMLTDSDVSEDYDGDLFFEANKTNHSVYMPQSRAIDRSN